MKNFLINNMNLQLTMCSLDILFYIGSLILALLIIIISNKGYLSYKLQRFCRYNSNIEFISILIIISAIILFIINVLLVTLSYLFIDFKFDIIMMVNDSNTTNVNNTNLQDPVRFWPSGVTQSWACIGGAVLLYRSIPGSPRIKAVAALSSLGITAPMAILTQAIENPIGFNRFMYSLSEYKKTGSWPYLPDNRVINDSDLNTIIDKAAEEAINHIKNQGANYLPDNVSIFQSINDQLNIILFNLSKSAPVDGYLDDLIGQQLYIYILLLIVVISTIILFTVYLFIQLIISNRDYILNKFNNKYIKLFLKYQLILSQISSFILPIFIMSGLLQLLIGIYFLFTHMIPYESLGIDLHTYVSRK